MNLRPTLLVLQACLVAATAFAQPAQNPPGFNAPDGHYPERTNSLSFGRYEKHDTFICQPQKKKCTEQDPGFTAKGTAAAEGPMVTTTYKRSDGKNIEGLNMQRNYERVIREMGGRLLAVMQGHDPGRGYMRQAHLLERNGQRQWIMVDTWGDSTRLLVTVVTLGDAPQVLSAAALQQQIDSQGYATLNLNFDTNKAELRDADRPTLEQVVQLLKASPGLQLSVDGHTDNVGQAAANKQLSQQRAQAIVDHLVAAGIARERLTAKGHGMEVPVGDNRSEEGRAKNRRVELVKLTAGGAAAAPAVAPAATAVAPAAPAAGKAAVQVVPPEALLAFLKANPQVVVLFTSPSLKCGYCVGADKTFDEVVTQLDATPWRYVRTEWTPWNQYPPVAVDAGVLGIPDHVVFRPDRAPAHVSGRIKDTRELAEKIRTVQKAQP